MKYLQNKSCRKLNNKSVFYKYIIYCISIIYLLIGCNIPKLSAQNNSEDNSSQNRKQFLPPIIVFAGAPDSKQLTSEPFAYQLPFRKNNDGSTILNGDYGGISYFTNFNTEQGLALSTVYCSALDGFGNIWFGTAGGGLCRFDGKTFTTFSIAHGLVNKLINCMIIDKHEYIWIGSTGGINCYDGKTFISFTTEQGIPNSLVACVFEDSKGDIWFGTGSGGIGKFTPTLNEKQKLKNLSIYTTAQGLIDNGVASIKEDKNGTIWIGTFSAGICSFDGKTFTPLSTAHKYLNNTIGYIHIDKSGTIWFGTDGGGIIRYDPKLGKQSMMTITTEQGLAHNSPKCFWEDSQANLWIGTDGGGVSCIDLKVDINTALKTMTTYTVSEGLSNNFIYNILEDKTSNLWFSTNGSGISRYNGNSLVWYNSTRGITNPVFSIHEDKKNNLWLATNGGGVFKFDGKTVANYTPEQGLVHKSIISIFESSDSKIWFGSMGGGIACFDGKTFDCYSTIQGLTNNWVFSIIEDNNKNIWLCTYGGGISRFDGKTFATYGTEQGLANNIVNCSYKDKAGNLWFGTESGLSRCNPAAEFADGENFFTNFTTRNGLPNNSISAIFEDKEGNIWVGTSEGASFNKHKTKHSDSTKLFTTFTTEDGLGENFVLQINQDSSGRMYFGTNQGISIIVGWKAGKPQFENYNNQTGYPIKDINSGKGTLYFDHKGILWAGTGDTKTSLIRFDYKAMKRNIPQPKVIIQNIKINEENISWYSLLNSFQPIDSVTLGQQEAFVFGKKLSTQIRDSIVHKFEGISFDDISAFYPIPENLILPYSHNHVTFEFAAIEPSRFDLIHYQYKLEGYDNHWSPVSKRTTAVYGNIQEGTYTFFLKAQTPDGIWTEPVSYTFTVRPPWYRTWWAYLSYILLLITAFYSGIKINTYRLKREKIELENIVMERTAEINQKKEEIQAKADYLEMANQEITSQKEEIQRSHKNMTDSILYAKRIQTAVLPNNELIQTLIPSHFILFKPRDIVSGDFYFLKRIRNYTLIAAADCTGHGVPGAFMSMLGVALLNEIVSKAEVQSASQVLDDLRTQLKNSLQQTGQHGEQQDGLDIEFCAINNDTLEMSFAGAYNPCWIFRNELRITNYELQIENDEQFVIRNSQFVILEADRQPVGIYIKEKPFTEHKFQLQKGDVIYLFSDGYQSQFGGDKNETFKVKRFKDLLSEIYQLPMQKQKEIMEAKFLEWKGTLEQTDDVLVVGIKI